jgi:regulator of protease activity HflC (stomatin/prohibitin superfamily)
MLRRASVRIGGNQQALWRFNAAAAVRSSSDRQRSADPSHFVLRPPRNKILHIVPQGTTMVVERLGKFSRILEPGITMLLPLVDRIRYMYSSKEQGIVIPQQSAITRDNVMVDIDGVLFLRIVDPIKASYNIDNPVFNVIALAQTTMRCEIGKLTLDHLFAERDQLNRNIVNVIQTEAQEWGVECKRYEIRDVAVSDIVRQSMDLQAEAERRKRKLVLESQGEMEATINRAKGQREAQEHNAEAARLMTEVNAKATAAAMKAVASATAESLVLVAKGFDGHARTQDAAALRIAEQYLEHFGNVAKESTTVVLPTNVADGASMATNALAMFGAVSKTLHLQPAAAAGQKVVGPTSPSE